MKRLVRVSFPRVATLVLFLVVVPGAIMLHSAGYLFYKPPVSQDSDLTPQDIQVMIKAYLQEYKQLCESQSPPRGNGDLPLCPCLPQHPAGWFDVAGWYSQLQGSTPSSILEQWTQIPTPQPLTLGGHWKPESCRARQRAAIIIPFRNRDEHLQVFVRYMHSFLQRQLLDYTIFVIEQSAPDIFNRAALMNIGFLEANKQDPKGFDCYIFHDVDLLPEDDRNMYTCYKSPLHLGAYMNKFNYEMPYAEFFGGAIGLSRSHVLKINGFANNYYGWGGEDDDTYNRVRLRNLTINRYPQAVGQSFMFKHDADEDNPKNPLRDRGFNMVVEEYDRVGLSTIKYTQDKVTQTEKYTKVTVSIEREYDKKCIINKLLPATVPGNYMNCQTREHFNAGGIECCTSVLSSELYCCNTVVRYQWMLRSVFVCGIVIGLIIPVILIRQWRKRRPLL